MSIINLKEKIEYHFSLLKEIKDTKGYKRTDEEWEQRKEEIQHKKWDKENDIEKEKFKNEFEKETDKFKEQGKLEFDKEINKLKEKAKNESHTIYYKKSSMSFYNFFNKYIDDNIKKIDYENNKKTYIHHIFSTINEYKYIQIYIKDLSNINDKIQFYYNMQKYFDLLNEKNITNFDIENFIITIKQNYINNEIESINLSLETLQPSNLHLNKNKIEIYKLINNVENLISIIYEIYSRTYEEKEDEYDDLSFTKQKKFLSKVEFLNIKNNLYDLLDKLYDLKYEFEKKIKLDYINNKIELINLIIKNKTSKKETIRSLMNQNESLNSIIHKMNLLLLHKNRYEYDNYDYDNDEFFNEKFQFSLKTNHKRYLNEEEYQKINKELKEIYLKLYDLKYYMI